jgi:hypothetical protein
MDADKKSRRALMPGKSVYEAGHAWASTANAAQLDAMKQCQRECAAQGDRPPPAYTFGCIEDAVIDPPGSGGYNSNAVKVFCLQRFGHIDPSFSEVLAFMAGAMTYIEDEAKRGVVTPSSPRVKPVHPKIPARKAELSRLGGTWAKTATKFQEFGMLQAFRELMNMRVIRRDTEPFWFIADATVGMLSMSDPVEIEVSLVDEERFCRTWFNAPRPMFWEVQAFASGAVEYFFDRRRGLVE